eukprot:4150603-Amphidinium_carterae.1
MYGTTWPSHVFDPEYRDYALDLTPEMTNKVLHASEWVSPTASGLDQLPLQYLCLTACRKDW